MELRPPNVCLTPHCGTAAQGVDYPKKPFGLSLSKAFPSLDKKGKRFDRLTANGVL
jgi:hypothetical protein